MNALATSDNEAVLDLPLRQQGHGLRAAHSKGQKKMKNNKISLYKIVILLKYKIKIIRKF